jgi:type IX secretion system PorP/SprF family membrane protein
MIKNCIFLLLLFFSCLLRAQPVLPLSGFQHNNMLYNPAYAGMKEGIFLAVIHKTQWIGFTGGPKFYGVSLHTPFNYERYGIGINLLNESAGKQNYINLNGNFSYKVNFLKGRLSLGARLGLVEWSDHSDKLLTREEEIITANKKIAPDISIGLFYKDKHWNVGISLSCVTSIYNNISTNGKMYYYFNLSYAKKIQQHFILYPAFLFRYTRPFFPEVNFSIPLEYRKTLWVGITYRSSSTYAFMAGININQLFKNNHDLLQFFYYYDYSTKTSKNFGNSHEIMLVFNPGKNRNIEKIKRKRATVNPLLFD